MQNPRLTILAALSVIPLLAACSQSENEIAKGPFPSTSASSSTSGASGAASLGTASSGTASVPPSDSASAVLSSHEVLGIALSDAKAFVSYDYRTLDAHFAAVEKRMTSAFSAQFASTVKSLVSLIKSSHGVATVTSATGTVSSFTPDTSVDDITLTQHNVSTTQKVNKTSHLIVTETHQPNGQWLLSKVTIAT